MTVEQQTTIFEELTLAKARKSSGTVAAISMPTLNENKDNSFSPKGNWTMSSVLENA